MLHPFLTVFLPHELKRSSLFYLQHQVLTQPNICGSFKNLLSVFNLGHCPQKIIHCCQIVISLCMDLIVHFKESSGNFLCCIPTVINISITNKLVEKITQDIEGFFCAFRLLSDSYQFKMVKFNPGLNQSRFSCVRTCNSCLQNAIEPLLEGTVML